MIAPRLSLPAEILLAIEREARAAMPKECCGLLEGWRAAGAIHIVATHPARNLSREPDRRFEIDPTDQFRLMRTLRGSGRGIVGCYHSHPNGRAEPSPRDAACASEEGFVWVIAAIEPRGRFCLHAFLFAGTAFASLPLDVRREPATPAAAA